MAKSDRKVALITGSASGVGAATARLLAGRGYNVVINYTKSEAEAHAVAEDCRQAGADVLVCRADVSSDADCRRMVAETVAKWGRIDALVNSAGWTRFVHHADLEGLTSEDFLRTLQINLMGPFQMVRAAAPAGAVGRAFGVVTIGFSVGGTFGPMLFGWILDRGAAPWIFGVSVISVSLHISEPTRLRRISYAVFCLNKNNNVL